MTPPLEAFTTIAPVPAKTRAKVPRNSARKRAFIPQQEADASGPQVGRVKERRGRFRSEGRPHFLRGEAIGVLPLEPENDGLVTDLRGRNRVLRDHLVLVLDFDRQGIVVEEFRGFFEDRASFPAASR